MNEDRPVKPTTTL